MLYVLRTKGADRFYLSADGLTVRVVSSESLGLREEKMSPIHYRSVATAKGRAAIVNRADALLLLFLKCTIINDGQLMSNKIDECLLIKL